MVPRNEEKGFSCRVREAAAAARELVSVLERRRPNLAAVRRAERKTSCALAELRLVAAALAARRNPTP